jgi:hypothetical protein
MGIYNRDIDIDELRKLKELSKLPPTQTPINPTKLSDWVDSDSADILLEEAPTKIIVDGVEKTEADTPKYNSEVPDDMSVVVGGYIDSTDNEYNAKRANSEDYSGTRTEGFKTEYEAEDKYRVNHPERATINDIYDQIAYPKLTKYVSNEFDLVVDSDEVDGKLRKLESRRRDIQPLRESIYEAEATLERLRKIRNAVDWVCAKNKTS